jgi:biopolymer transport protein ExbB
MITSNFEQIIETIKLGGIAVYPLLFFAILATALIFDKIFLYKKLVALPKILFETIETYNFAWNRLEAELSKLPTNNIYSKFFGIILNNRQKPIWWIESRAGDEAKLIQEKLSRGLWILETIITAAPLVGLLGTITGMMKAFKLIGTDGIVNPTGITGGVAEALIATALGLLIAVIALFAFNYFSKRQDQITDELERLGTRIVDHIKLDQK